jgi:methyl-accepting chemotaxis protein
MNILQEELREKEKDFTQKSARATMIFCILIEIIFVLGFIYKFMIINIVFPLLVALIFASTIIIHTLCRRNIFSPVLPYLIITITTLVFTIAFGFVHPAVRIPFFLIYFYIVLHPAMLLGARHGMYAIVLVDLSYIVMVFLTRSYFPATNIQLELIKLVFFSFIALFLISQLDRNLKRIQKLRAITAEAEQGDLMQRLSDDEKDEISFLSQGLNRLFETESKMIKIIKEIVNSLSDMSEQIATTASEIATSISEIAQTTQKMNTGITEQFNELEKTIARTKSLEQASFDVVNNVKKIESFSLNVSDSATKAIDHSDVVTNNIEVIGKRYDYLISLMRKLQDVSVTINKIIGTMDSISEKINILSLNASIEAARAGEYGRGFSIVADEVKKLADSSQESASEIGKIVREMMESINTVTESTEEVNKAITNGTVVIKSTVESLKGISNMVLDLNTAIKNIKDMISREETEINDIVRKVESSHGISKENMAAAEQILASVEEQSAASQQFSATSEELVAVSNKLKEMIQNFQIEKEGE